MMNFIKFDSNKLTEKYPILLELPLYLRVNYVLFESDNSEIFTKFNLKNFEFCIFKYTTINHYYLKNKINNSKFCFIDFNNKYYKIDFNESKEQKQAIQIFYNNNLIRYIKIFNLNYYYFKYIFNYKLFFFEVN